MDKLKFLLFSIISVLVVALLGYWAVVSMQSGGEHASLEEVRALVKENEELKEAVEGLEDKVTLLQSQLEEPVVEIDEEDLEGENTDSNNVSYKYQTNINELQKLVSDGVYMKLKSRGTRVGSVQKFLNIYNGSNSSVDNDYGNTTKKLVTQFQKDQGITADGEAGPATFEKMIDWLKKQG